MFSDTNLFTSSAVKRSGLDDLNNFNGRPRFVPRSSHMSSGTLAGNKRRKFGMDSKRYVCVIFRLIALNLSYTLLKWLVFLTLQRNTTNRILLDFAMKKIDRERRTTKIYTQLIKAVRIVRLLSKLPVVSCRVIEYLTDNGTRYGCGFGPYILLPRHTNVSSTSRSRHLRLVPKTNFRPNCKLKTT